LAAVASIPNWRPTPAGRIFIIRTLEPTNDAYALAKIAGIIYAKLITVNTVAVLSV
jgi:hypothetical protein